MLRLVIFLALLAAVVYAVFWLIDRRSRGKGDGGLRPLRPGPVGPDDDEEFLRQLERRSRHAREREAKKRPDAGPTKPRSPDSTQDGPSGVTPGSLSDPAGDSPAPRPSGDTAPGGAGELPAPPAGASPNGRPDRAGPADEEPPRDGSRHGSARGSDLEDPGSDEDA